MLIKLFPQNWEATVNHMRAHTAECSCVKVTFNRNVLIWLQATHTGLGTYKEFTQNRSPLEQNLHLADINQEQEMFFQLSTPPKAALGRSSRRRGSPSSSWPEQWHQLGTKPCWANRPWGPPATPTCSSLTTLLMRWVPSSTPCRPCWVKLME